MNKYTYDGPVMEFNTCISSRWRASTYAPSEKRAKSNLTFRFKRENNRVPGSAISLPGRITLVGQKEA